MPLSSGRPLTLIRRDLFDARFQLISDDGRRGGADVGEKMHPAQASALEFIEAPSDLVPGVYEGGLKTWECSLDLVNYLDGLENSFTDGHIQEKRVLEVPLSLLRREPLANLSPSDWVRYSRSIVVSPAPIVLVRSFYQRGDPATSARLQRFRS